MARPIALVILFALPWAAAGTVRAQAPASVDWRAPAQCPDGAQVGEAVDRLLGRPVAPDDGVALRGEVVAVEGGGFELTLGDGPAGRVLRADSCEVLAEAAALIVAMAIDPDAVAQAPPSSEPASEPERAEASADIASPPLAAALGAPRAGETEQPPHRKTERALAERSVEGPPSSASAGAGLRVHVAAGIGMDAGTLPGVALAPHLAAGLSFHRTRIELVGVHLPSRGARADNHATARGEVSLLALALRACVAAVDGAVELGPCAALELGALGAEGEGVTTPGASTATWASASAGAFVAVPLADWLALRADAAGALALTRPAFVIEGVDGTVHRPGAIAARLSVGAEVRFR